MRALADRAGVATGTVYNYFANKDELLLALTEHGLGRPEAFRAALLHLGLASAAASW